MSSTSDSKPSGAADGLPAKTVIAKPEAAPRAKPGLKTEPKTAAPSRPAAAAGPARPAAASAPSNRPAAASATAALEAAARKPVPVVPTPAPVAAAPTPLVAAMRQSGAPPAPSGPAAVDAAARSAARSIDTPATSSEPVTEEAAARHPAADQGAAITPPQERSSAPGRDGDSAPAAAPATPVSPAIWAGSLGETAAQTSKGLLEIHAKMIDLMRAQTMATLEFWNAMLRVTSLSEAMQLQTRELRKSYESTSEQLKDLAETTGRVANQAMKPWQGAIKGSLRRIA